MIKLMFFMFLELLIVVLFLNVSQLSRVESKETYICKDNCTFILALAGC